MAEGQPNQELIRSLVTDEDNQPSMDLVRLDNNFRRMVLSREDNGKPVHRACFREVLQSRTLVSKSSLRYIFETYALIRNVKTDRGQAMDLSN